MLSFRSSDEEGNLALPSPFIDDVAELLDPEWRERRRRRLLGDVVWPPELAPTEREVRHALAAAAPLPVVALTSPPQTLSEGALVHVRHNRIVSGGALELYATCPVKWLVERELSPPRFEPESDPFAKGSYMHRVLEEVIGRLDGPITPESLPDAERILRAWWPTCRRRSPRAGRPRSGLGSRPGSRPTCAATCATRRRTAPTGSRPAWSCASGLRTTTDSLALF